LPLFHSIPPGARACVSLIHSYVPYATSISQPDWCGPVRSCTCTCSALGIISDQQILGPAYNGYLCELLKIVVQQMAEKSRSVVSLIICHSCYLRLQGSQSVPARLYSSVAGNRHR